MVLAMLLFCLFGLAFCLTFFLCIWFLLSGVGWAGLDTGESIIKGCIIML